jgi:hypothetical protein
MDYLLSDRDANQIERSHVAVVRGDPVQVVALADSRDTVWRYSAGVIAWEGLDRPSREQVDAVLDDFERVTSAGLSEPMCWTAVQHGRLEDSGGVHVHFVIARHDSGSGKAWNPAPPGWEKDFGVFQDAWNAKTGWADPREPERARAVGLPNHVELERAGALKRGQVVNEDIRETITNWAEQRIAHGTIASRADLVDQLVEQGWTIHRQAKTSISVREHRGAASIRLKGGIYEHDWTVTGAGHGSEDASADRGRSVGVSAGGDGRAEEAEGRLREVFDRRFEAQSRRHRPRESQGGGGRQADESGRHVGGVVADLGSSVDLRGVAGSGLVGEGAVDRGGDTERGDHQEGGRVRGVDGQGVDHLQQRWADEAVPTSAEGGEVGDDRTGTKADRLIARASRAHRAADSAHRKMERTIRRVGKAVRGLRDAGGRVDAVTRPLKAMQAKRQAAAQAKANAAEEARRASYTRSSSSSSHRSRGPSRGGGRGR